ncbi:MAG: hypothetical protein ACTMHS_12955 [Micrococcaceae bacterium]
MTTQSRIQRQNPAAARAAQLWMLVGLGIVLYVVVHIIQMLFIGFGSDFEGQETSTMWAWAISLGIMALPTLLSGLGSSRVIAWIVFVTGIISVLVMAMIAWRYGIAAGAGYLALVIAVFVLVPQGFALTHTFHWAREAVTGSAREGRRA